MITSKDNSRIKGIVALNGSAKRRRELSTFVLEGTRLCGEALREDIRVKELLFTEDTEKSNPKLIADLKTKAEFYSLVSRQVFEKISDTCSPQGVLVTFSFKKTVLPPEKGRFIAFERVSDPSNLGAAARTAEALGFAGIILSKKGVDPYSPKSLRASMGALLRLPVIYADDILSCLKTMGEKGFTVSGTVVDSNAEKLGSITFSQNEIALIGNEAEGLTDEAKLVCHRLITIPMTGRAESLNAAAAAGIVMWEMVR